MRDRDDRGTIHLDTGRPVVFSEPLAPGTPSQAQAARNLAADAVGLAKEHADRADAAEAAVEQLVKDRDWLDRHYKASVEEAVQLREELEQAKHWKERERESSQIEIKRLRADLEASQAEVKRLNRKANFLAEDNHNQAVQRLSLHARMKEGHGEADRLRAELAARDDLEALLIVMRGIAEDVRTELQQHALKVAPTTVDEHAEQAIIITAKRPPTTDELAKIEKMLNAASDGVRQPSCARCMKEPALSGDRFPYDTFCACCIDNCHNGGASHACAVCRAEPLDFSRQLTDAQADRLVQDLKDGGQ